MNAISFGLWFSMNCGHLLFLSPVTRLIIGLSAGLASKNWARFKAAFIPLRSTSFVCFVWDQVAVDLVIFKILFNEFLRTQRSRLCFHSYANVYKCCRCFFYICYFEWLMNLQKTKLFKWTLLTCLVGLVSNNRVKNLLRDLMHRLKIGTLRIEMWLCEVRGMIRNEEYKIIVFWARSIVNFILYVLKLCLLCCLCLINLICVQKDYSLEYVWIHIHGSVTCHNYYFVRWNGW